MITIAANINVSVSDISSAFQADGTIVVTLSSGTVLVVPSTDTVVAALTSAGLFAP